MPRTQGFLVLRVPCVFFDFVVAHVAIITFVSIDSIGHLRFLIENSEQDSMGG